MFFAALRHCTSYSGIFSGNQTVLAELDGSCRTRQNSTILAELDGSCRTRRFLQDSTVLAELGRTRRFLQNSTDLAELDGSSRLDGFALASPFWPLRRLIDACTTLPLMSIDMYYTAPDVNRHVLHCF